MESLNRQGDVWKTKHDTPERNFPGEASAARRRFTERPATREQAFRSQPSFKRGLKLQKELSEKQETCEKEQPGRT